MTVYTLWGLLNRDIKILTYRNNKSEVMKKLTESNNLFSGVELRVVNELIEKFANSRGIPFPMGDLTPGIRAWLDSIVIDLPFDDD